MCDRFSLDTPPEELVGHFDLDKPLALRARFNIAPSQFVPIVREAAVTRSRSLRFATWGLVPDWSIDGKPGPISGRSETVSTQHPFADSFASRRCLIPTTGFYEWAKEGQRRIPSYFRHKGGGLMAFAGLWSVWVNPDSGKQHFSCCLLTTEPNELVKPVHDRMPVILGIDEYAVWLDLETGESKLKAMFKPYPAERMESWPVAMLVNKATVEGPQLIAPVEAA